MCVYTIICHFLQLLGEWEGRGDIVEFWYCHNTILCCCPWSSIVIGTLGVLDLVFILLASLRTIYKPILIYTKT